MIKIIENENGFGICLTEKNCMFLSSCENKNDQLSVMADILSKYVCHNAGVSLKSGLCEATKACFESKLQGFRDILLDYKNGFITLEQMQTEVSELFSSESED